MGFENKNGGQLYKRGQIYNATLSGTQGSEQGGLRPVLIVQNNIGNKFSPTITIVPLTSELTKAKLPTHVELEGYGLNFKSVILIEQIRTIDKRRLRDYIGQLNEELMEKVNKGILIHNGIINEKEELVKEKISDVEGLDKFICRWLLAGGAIKDIESYIKEIKYKINEINNIIYKYRINIKLNVEYQYVMEDVINLNRMVG